jgi:hypothetical protein
MTNSSASRRAIGWDGTASRGGTHWFTRRNQLLMVCWSAAPLWAKVLSPV